MALTPKALQLLRRKTRAALGLPITVPNEEPSQPELAETEPSTKMEKGKKAKSEIFNKNSKKNGISGAKNITDSEPEVKKGKRKAPESKKTTNSELESKKDQKKTSDRKKDEPEEKIKPSIEDLDDNEWNIAYELPKLKTYPDFKGNLNDYYKLDTVLRLVKIFDFNTTYLSILSNAEFDILEFDMFYLSLMTSPGHFNIYLLYLASQLAYTLLSLNESSGLPPLTFANSESIIEKAFKELPDSKSKVQFEFLKLNFNEKLEFFESLIDYIVDHKQFNLEVESFESKKYNEKIQFSSYKNHVQALESSIKTTIKAECNLEREIIAQSALKANHGRLNKLKQELAFKKDWLEKKQDLLDVKKKELDNQAKLLVKGYSKGVGKLGLMAPFNYYQMLNLGQDRFGRNYWHWPFLGGVWVQDVDINLNSKDKWYVIHEKQLFDKLIDNLNRRGFREAKLFKILSRHQPNIEKSFKKYDVWLNHCKKLEKLKKLPESICDSFVERALLFISSNQPSELGKDKNTSKLDGTLHSIKLNRGVLEIDPQSRSVIFRTSDLDLFFGPLQSFEPFKQIDKSTYDTYLIKSVSKLFDQLTIISFDYLTTLGVTGNARLSKSMKLDIESLKSLPDCIKIFKAIVESSLSRIQTYLVLNNFVKSHFKILKINKVLKRFSKTWGNSSLTSFSAEFLDSFSKLSWWLSKLILELDPKSFDQLEEDSSTKSETAADSISHCKVHIQGATQYPCHNHYDKAPQYCKRIKLANVKVIEILSRGFPEVELENKA